MIDCAMNFDQIGLNLSCVWLRMLGQDSDKEPKNLILKSLAPIPKESGTERQIWTETQDQL